MTTVFAIFVITIMFYVAAFVILDSHGDTGD